MPQHFEKVDVIKVVEILLLLLLQIDLQKNNQLLQQKRNYVTTRPMRF
jgi:hypothetical protein